MRTARPALALLVPLALAGLVVPAGAATAADGTCQGQTATVAATPGSTTLTGTEGDDVIAADPTTTRVVGRGGNDVVCSWAGSSVEAGAGDDRVVVTPRPGTDARSTRTTVSLGAGNDSYTGADGVDRVDEAPADRLGVDVVTTGAGDDVVGSGVAGETNADVVDLGSGADSLLLTLPTGSAMSADGGADGADLVLDDPGTGSWVVDLRGSLGTISHDAPTYAARLRGFDDVTAHLPGAASLDVRGNKAHNRVTVSPTPLRLRVDLKAGDDQLQLDAVADATRGRVTLGGQAHDRARVSSGGALSVALGERRVPGRLTLAGVHRLTGVAPVLDLQGSAARDVLRLQSCRAVARAGDGNDTVRTYQVPAAAGFACAGTTPQPGQVAVGTRAVGARVLGGPGDDTLVGSDGRDQLVGGAGRDRADGRAGRDTCAAERETSCER